MASVCLRGPDGEIVCDMSTGNGPVDAVYEAIDKIVQVPTELVEVSIQAITEGMDAMGKVTIRIRDKSENGNSNGIRRRVIMGRGADTDVIVAAARAYVFAINRLLAARQVRGQKTVVDEEVRQSMAEMRAQYGTAHNADFMGWGVLRKEGLK